MRSLLHFLTGVFLALVAVVSAHTQELKREAVHFAPLGKSDIGTTVGQLYLPYGPGPFAAVVVLHGCGGVRENSYRWAEELVRLGIAALVADHFSPRGIDRICERYGGKIVEQRERRRDTYGALMYLSQRPEIDSGRIAVMGFSNGGLATINALVPGLNDPVSPRFLAGIALYPDCTGYIRLKLSAPLMILIGEKDDWTPVSVCQRMIDELPSGSAAVSMEVFPGASHSFDDETQRYMYLSAVFNPHKRSQYGAIVSYDRGAHRASIEQVRQFVQQHLAAPRVAN
jgi:dienelactone hydrolase